MTNPITYKTALEIASHEALIRQAYKDSVGVWTWSVGLTSATGHDVLRYKANPNPLSIAWLSTFGLWIDMRKLSVRSSKAQSLPKLSLQQPFPSTGTQALSRQPLG